MSVIVGACGPGLSEAGEDIPQQLLSWQALVAPGNYDTLSLLDTGECLNDPRLQAGSIAFLSSSIENDSGARLVTAPSSVNNGKRFAVSYVGYIVNSGCLRTELGRRGIQVDGLTELGLLSAGIEYEGWEFVRRVKGAFVIFALDMVRRQLYIACDELGLKTCYFVRRSDLFCFSTHLPSLLRWKNMPRRANPGALYSFLRNGIMAASDQTLFLDIAQLPPGHFVTVKINEPAKYRVQEYARIEVPAVVDIPFHEAAGKVRDLFLESVAKLSGVDHQVGASLSGGTDSTAVVSAMRAVMGSNAPIPSFSYVAADDQTLSEESWIDLASQSATTKSHKLLVTSDDFVRDIDQVTGDDGEPLVGTSQYVQWKIFQQANAAGVNIILDGIGGDAATAGHAYLVVDRIAYLIRQRRFAHAAELILKTCMNPKTRTSRALAISAIAYLPRPFQRVLTSSLGQSSFPDWLDANWFMERAVFATPPQAYKEERPMQHHMLDALRGSQLVRHAERNSLAASVQSRLPFYYGPFVTFMLSLPDDYLISDNGETRRIFHHAMRGLVPDPILDRTDKLGFQPPQHLWLSEQADWVQSALQLGRETGIPINIESKTLLQRSHRIAPGSLVRCVTASIWAAKFNVTFE